MTKLQIGYKVTNIFSSSVSCLSKNSGKMQYNLNKKTYHNFGFGAIAVFDTLENALKFIVDDLHAYIDRNYTERIFEVEYKPETNPLYQDLYFSTRLTLHSFIHGSMFKNLYKNYLQENTDIFPIPRGTQFARHVKLIREVEPHILKDYSKERIFF